MVVRVLSVARVYSQFTAVSILQFHQYSPSLPFYVDHVMNLDTASTLADVISHLH